MWIRSATSALLLFAVGACAPDLSITTKPNDPEETYAIVTVDPPLVDFGELASDDVERRTVTVSNVGFSVLAVDEVLLTGPGAFTLELGSEAFPRYVDPGASTTFDVTFQPDEGGEVEARVEVVTDARDNGRVPVDLLGFGAFPHLTISPVPMRFGDRFVPCDTEQTFTLTNDGGETLVVSSIGLEGDVDQLTLGVNQPDGFSIAAGATVRVPVRFAPARAGSVNAEFVVVSDDPGGEARVDVTGAGRFLNEVTDTFDVPELLPIDILFAVDQSCSMGDQQTTLAQQFGAFINILDAADVDWKVAVYTGSDPACFERGILTPNTPGWSTSFSAAVRQGGNGSTWDGAALTEAHLEGVQRAIANDRPGGCNYGFRDPGAPLHIIMVSDERDQSSGWTGASNYWTSYWQSMSNYAGSGSLTVHAIVDTQSACGESPLGPGGYRELANFTHGSVLNVCGAWASQFQGIARSAIDDLSFYELSEDDLAVSSIEVTIDGVPVTTGWTYDAARGGLVFDPLPPTPSHIEVTYGQVVTCSN